MAGNTIGQLFTLSTFGESHGAGIGGIIDGCPAGLNIDMAFIQKELDRRKPGQSAIVSPRKESDTISLLSGVFEGKSTGAPIAFFIPNEDQKSKDYEHLKDTFRPSHADYTYEAKYGFRDYRGGGRSSARETAARVAGGAIAKLLLQQTGIHIKAYVSRVKDIELNKPYTQLDLNTIEDTAIRCPDTATAQAMIDLIEATRKTGDTLGGIVSCVITDVPAGWGEPVFDRLHADLGKAVLSINAVKGFDYGSGFEGTRLQGSEHNDVFRADEGQMHTATNHSGGIQGGISNGEDIYFRVAFKPVATILQSQESANRAGKLESIQGKGRHDPCVLPRAVPIVEAMAALVLADHFLRAKTSRIDLF